jgi:hypothetical protein
MPHLKRINNILVLSILFFSVVLPNSSKLFVIGVMGLCVVISVCYIDIGKMLKKLLLFYVASVFITILFIFIGSINGATQDAVLQTVAVYIISPFLWLIISIYFVQNFSEKNIITTFSYLSLLACASVGLYFYLFLNFGESAVAFFGSRGNVNMSDTGYSGAIMHVFGSIIFLAAGFFIYPRLLLTKTLRYSVLISIFIVVVFAGRTALTVAMFLSLALVLCSLVLKTVLNKYSSFQLFFRSMLLLFSFYIVVIFIYNVVGVDFFYIIERFANKIQSGGGSERTNQAISLFNGIADTYLLGSGHGIGVEYIRSDDYPWRYELVWLATLFRTGFIGATIYVLPFVYYFYVIIYRWKKGKLRSLDKFFSGGLLSALLASNTNPYIEAISFQWMFIIPLVYLFNDGNNTSNEQFKNSYFHKV